MRLSRNFTLLEMTKSQIASRHGLENMPTLEQIENLRRLCVRVLEPVRAKFGVPYSPSSGFRSPKVNALAGGGETSQHLTGHAVDFEVPGISNYGLAQWILVNLCFDNLILEYYVPAVPSSGWVHVSYVEPYQRNRRQVLTKQAGLPYSVGLLS